MAMQAGVKNTIFTKKIITSICQLMSAVFSCWGSIKWGDYIFGQNMDSNLHLHGKKGFSWFGSKTAELDSWKWPISQPHQSFWVHFVDDSSECGNPKSEGDGSAGSSAAAMGPFPISCRFQLMSCKSGGTSCDQSLQMFHWCFLLPIHKFSSHSI